MTKAKEKSLIILFLIIIGIPYILWFFLSGFMDSENYEKRELAERPVFDWRRIDEFSIDVENYVNDYLPFRNQMIRFNNVLEYYVFDHSNNENVIIGKDGWLFYKESEESSSMECYKGTNLFTEEQLQQMLDNLLMTRDNLAVRGCEFVLFIPSNKERIYAEYVPDYYGEPAEEYATLQLVEYIREHSDIRVVYPYEAMMEAKAALGGEVLLYHKTDTHWNELGGYVGTSELLKELGIEMSALKDENIRIEQKEDVPGDLADLLNLGDSIDPGKAYTVEGYDMSDVEVVQMDTSMDIVHKNKNKDPRRFFMIRDSFGIAMVNPIASQFNYSYTIPIFHCTEDLIEEQDPDIVVLEVLERYVNRLLTFSYDDNREEQSEGA